MSQEMGILSICMRNLFVPPYSHESRIQLPLQQNLAFEVLDT